MQNTYRFMAAKKLKQIIDSAGRSNVLQKRQLYVVKALNKKLAAENAIIAQADKGKTIVAQRCLPCVEPLFPVLAA